MRRSLAFAALALPALACQTTQAATDGGCVDAGANTVCGGPQGFNVAFAGLDFPELDDGGNPIPNVLDVVLADHDLSAACSATGAVPLPAFTAVDIRVEGYTLPVDAGVYTSPTVLASEFSWSDGGTTLLGESDETWVQIESVTNQAAVGYFTADMALPTSGLVSMWGDFSATSCQGLHTALGSQ